MSHTRIRLLAFVASALVVWVGAAAVRRLDQDTLSKLEQPALSVDPEGLDIGEAWETDRFEWALPVHNHASVSATASASSSSCGCVAPMASVQLPAGGAALLKVQIDLRKQCAAAEPQAARDTAIRLFLSHETPGGTQQIPVELHGRIKSAVAGVPRRIDFGCLSASANLSPRVIPIRSLVNLRDLAVDVDNPAVGAELKPCGAGRWDLHVRPLAAAIVGRHTANVTLTPVAGERIPPITMPVTFDVLHDIQPDIPLVPLGVGRVGESLAGTLTVRSLSGQAFPPPTCEGVGISVQVESKSPVSYTFKLSQVVATPGNQTTPISVRGCDAQGAKFELRVAVHCYGLSP